MASTKDAFRRAIAKYLGGCRRRGLSEKTITTYSWALRTVRRALADADLIRGPTTFDLPQARVAYDALNRSPMAMRFLNVFLNAHGNDILRRSGLLRPMGPPMRTRWLNLENGEDLVVYDTARQMGPPYSTLVHLELKLLFRRISCIRARRQHFHPERVVVHGKGRYGGKLYAVSPHPDTAHVLQEHEAWRQAKATTEAAPDYLFLAKHGGPYQSGGMLNRWLNEVERESGVPIHGHHTLRRTGGRKLWIAGVPLETVSEILGHQSLDMTIRYLGVGITDMAAAQRRLVEYEAEQRLVRVRQDRPSGTSQ